VLAEALAVRFWIIVIVVHGCCRREEIDERSRGGDGKRIGRGGWGRQAVPPRLEFPYVFFLPIIIFAFTSQRLPQFSYYLKSLISDYSH
jgi:hypothetical protein